MRCAKNTLLSRVIISTPPHRVAGVPGNRGVGVARCSMESNEYGAVVWENMNVCAEPAKMRGHMTEMRGGCGEETWKR